MAGISHDNGKKCRKYSMKKSGNGYKLDLDFGNLGDKLDKAQRELDAQVWDDVQKYMPYDTKNLINQTNALNVVTSKQVYLYPPTLDYGHYQHEGISRSGKPLHYHMNPNATAKWGETAYNNHAQEWVEVVRRAVQS